MHTVAAIVRVMCGMVVHEISLGNHQVLRDVKRIVGANSSSTVSDTTQTDAQESVIDGSIQELSVTSEQLCSHILHTVYMGTSNSSDATKSRSLRLARSIGSYHNSINIDDIIAAVLRVFSTLSSVVQTTSDSLSAVQKQAQ